VIIFNSAKYKAELLLGRKPMTDVEVIDEADEFLDSFFDQATLNITRLKNSLKVLYPDSVKAGEDVDRILNLIDLQEKNKRALGIQEDQVEHIKETKIADILGVLNSNSELQSEIAIDEMNYGNKALEVASGFRDTMSEVYVSFHQDEDDLYVKLVSTNLSGKFKELMNKSKALVFMSGTLHSEKLIRKVFSIEDFEVVEAETLNFGNAEIVRTGREFDCRYSGFKNGFHTREKYLRALNEIVGRAVKPALIHVNAFQDLPTEQEKRDFELRNLISDEVLKEIQRDDKTGRAVSLFKKGLSETLFSTRCNRGVDFPGDTCKSIVFTKYPNPNIQDTFWRVLKQNHPDYFWDFYKDKAEREFLQRIFRALRSQDDHVFILSPDIRVLNGVRKLQESMGRG
jgi:Rad3-related DNA helicase